jgi:uncharacterized protein (DUF924 family)
VNADIPAPPGPLSTPLSRRGFLQTSALAGAGLVLGFVVPAPLRRAFAYMPFEHAEDLACQDEAVARFTRLAQEAPVLQGMLDYAHKHREVIARFGRFPHRNAILGRASSPEEALFLQQPGSRF